MTPEDESDGPPDPQLDPAQSPGIHEDVDDLEDLDVDRPEVTLGEASPAELTAADTDPVAGADASDLAAALVGGTVPERRRAAIALGEREPTDTVVEALAASARDDDDREVRQFAVEALGELDADAAATVARAALDDENPWVRAEAVVVLDGCDREAFAGVIEERLDDDHHAVRRNALISLAKHREEMVETLCQFAEDDSERVREWVAELLGEYDDERAETALLTLADDDSDIVAQTASHALEGAERQDLFTRRHSPSPPADRRDQPPDL